MTAATYDEGPDRFVGRHRHPSARPIAWDDAIDAGTICPSPASHYHLERSAAQELRMPSTTDPDVCPWCEKPYNPGRA